MMIFGVSKLECVCIIMLQVEKDLLQAETLREVASLRSTELAYYVDHIGALAAHESDMLP